MNAPHGRGFELADLARVLAPSSPVALGNRVVYVLARIDAGKKKTFSSIWAVAASGAEPARRITTGDHAEKLPRADPRGRFLVFVSNRSGSEQVHRLDTDLGEARQLTALPRGSIADIAVSSDGSRLAVVLSPRAPEGEAVPLAADLAKGSWSDPTPTEAAPPIEPPSTAVHKDEGPPAVRVLDMLKNREDGVGFFSGLRNHIWIVDAVTGRAHRLTRGARDFAAPCFTPGGDALVAVVTPARVDTLGRDATRNDLVRIDIETGRLTELDKPDGLALAPSISPGGDAVAYTLAHADDVVFRRNAVACITPLGGGAPRVLTAHLDRTVGDVVLDDTAGGALTPIQPAWVRDGGAIVVCVSDRGSVRLYEQPIAGGPGRYLTDDTRVVSAPAKVGDSIAAVVATSASFAEIGLVTPAGELRVLTSHNAALAAEVSPRRPELVTIEREGVSMSAYYLAPRGARPGERHPGVLLIHGGPHVCFGERMMVQMQWLADVGFAVLYTNPRGSQSYGEAFTSAIHFHWGEPDSGDQLAFVDWLAARPEVDGDRIGVVGGSYGGFMALLLCATSKRFKAAVAQRGLFDWYVDLAGDYGHETPRLFGGVMPWEEPGRYHGASPLHLVDRVETPMLVIHAEDDQRTRLEQGLMLFAALKLRGVPTALVTFPQEGHGMSRTGRIDRRVEQLRQMRAWLDGWLR